MCIYAYVHIVPGNSVTWLLILLFFYGQTIKSQYCIQINVVRVIPLLQPFLSYSSILPLEYNVSEQLPWYHPFDD